MNIELSPCYKERGMYLLYAKDYVDTLREYEESIIWDEETWDKAIWDTRFIVSGGTMCGFVASQEVGFKNAPKLLYIEEFYIEPEERRKGVGIETVRELTNGWDGQVFFYVLNKNDGAMAFWDCVEKELKWKRTERNDIRREPGCKLRVYNV